MPYKYNEKYTREVLTEAVVNSIGIVGELRLRHSRVNSKQEGAVAQRQEAQVLGT
jgi:hypothetical protein